MGWYLNNIKNWESSCFVVTTIGEFAKQFGYQNKSLHDLYYDVVNNNSLSFYDEVVAYRNGDEDFSVGPDDISIDTKIQRMKMVVGWLVYTGLPESGIVEITDKNCEDLYKRILIIQRMYKDDRCKVYGSWAVYDAENDRLINKTEYKNLTLKDIRDHIGLVCRHGNRMSKAAFWKSIREDYDRWTERILEYEINKGGE